MPETFASHAAPQPSLLGDDPGLSGVGETARRAGRYRWIEERLFEVLGEWVASVPEVEVKVHLATESHHHGWHAQLWHERLPQRWDAAPGAGIPSPGDPLLSFAAALAEPEDTIERLVGVYRVLLPHKIATYTAHLRDATPVSDAPVIRALGLVLRDELDDWREGERLVQSLLTGDEEIRRAAARQAALESLLVRAGGVASAPTAAGSG